MKIILKQEVKNLGKEWDMVTVADGYARNFLLPRNLAMPATQASVKDLERRRQKASVRRQQEEEAARTLAGRMEGVIVEVTARAGAEGRLYGSITAADIADFLHGKGFDIDRRKIEIPEPLRTIGEHHVLVQLYSGVSVHLKVLVHPEGGPPVTATPAAAPADSSRRAEAPAPAQVDPQAEAPAGAAASMPAALDEAGA